MAEPRPRLLVDTNVLLDAVLRRAPFDAEALGLLAAVERGQLQGLVAPTTLTTVHYFARKAFGEDEARALLRELVSVLEVAPMGRPAVEAALASPQADTEDAFVAAAGHLAGATAVVTRDPAGFRGGPLVVLSPPEALTLVVPRS